MKIPFEKADILIPASPSAQWPVIACDQFTSDKGYWEKVAQEVGSAPSTLKLILPEVFLGCDVPALSENIHRRMEKYLDDGIFAEYKSSMVAVFRTLPSGKVRRGVVGKIRLADYSYADNEHLIRATEETVPERLPPRVAIRKGAPIELPHVLLFLDDPGFDAFPDGDGETLYDLPLMLGGGKVLGKLMTDAECDRFLSVCEKLTEKNGFTFAVGDGNHSLAAAKASGSEYALVEIVNLHDPAIVFEPIYRIARGIDLEQAFSVASATFTGGKNGITLYSCGIEKKLYTDAFPPAAVDALISELSPSSVDYIHGEDSLRELASDEDSIGFIFDGIAKSELFPYIRDHGVLPRKTFSMGTAYEKRYYLEAMKIKESRD